MTPFSERYNINKERVAIEQARAGSQDAAGQLVRMHQRFIYNLALKFVRDSDDAKDLTQEVLIKMLTKLMQFQFKSSFRTWLYRIAMNHFLSGKRRKAEIEINSFDEVGDVCDNLYNEETMTTEEQQKYSDEIIFLRNKCMASTLLCLDRQQRIILILGSVFNLKSPIAARLLDISPENFRKQLSRAKADLFQFMDNKCGLMNPANPCRCHKKTKGFIKDGIIDPETNTFSVEAIQSIASIVTGKNMDLDTLMEGKYLRLFTEQPYERIEEEDTLINSLLGDPDVKELFLLN